MIKRGDEKGSQDAGQWMALLVARAGFAERYTSLQTEIVTS
jgi:hypothetical protein